MISPAHRRTSSMTDHSPTLSTTTRTLSESLIRLGHLIVRYGLVIVLAWIGFGKYVKMESRVLIEHSPLMSWLYDVFSVTFVARALGTMEIVAALLIALRPVWQRELELGSGLAGVLVLGPMSCL